jgi:hypothetical protein
MPRVPTSQAFAVRPHRQRLELEPARLGPRGNGGGAELGGGER